MPLGRRPVRTAGSNGSGSSRRAGAANGAVTGAWNGAAAATAPAVTNPAISDGKACCLNGDLLRVGAPSGRRGEPDNLITTDMGSAPPNPANPRRRWAGEAALLLATALVCVPLLRTPGYAGDIERVKGWSRRVALHGLSAVYLMAGPYDVDYPPVTLYIDRLVGAGYRALADRSF